MDERCKSLKAFHSWRLGSCADFTLYFFSLLLITTINNMFTKRSVDVVAHPDERLVPR